MDNQDDFFDSVIMPFGTHKGEYIFDLPIKYLEWLQENIELKVDLKEAVSAAIDYNYGLK